MTKSSLEAQRERVLGTVVDAMAQQQSTLNVHSRYLHEGIVTFAERLTGLKHDGINCAVFSCSGTEAVDVALQMAGVATGAKGIVCRLYLSR